MLHSDAILGDLFALTEAASVEEVWSLYVKQMAQYDFDRILYGFTHYRTANSLGAPEDLFVLTNHESAYLDRFLGEKLYYHAPMVRWSLENTGACSWRWMEEQLGAGGFTPSELKVVEFNLSMDVKAGYSLSFKSYSHRTAAGMALTSKRGISQHETDQMWDEHGRDIMLISNIVHLKLITFPFVGKRRALTPRQREVLEWVGDGKTTQDIATIMGLTPATVEKHLRLAREVLDVETTAQAVLKASFQNQMFVVDA